MNERELECLRLAARQHGLIRRDQVLQYLGRGQIERRLDCGAWVSVLPRVYRVEGTRHDWYQRLAAVSLWAGQGFALSHHTAAALHGFRRFPPGPVELSATRHLTRSPGVVLHRVGSLAPKDFQSVHGFRVTSVTRTLVDLASTLPEAELRAAVDEALSRKWATVERLATAVARSERHPGVIGLRALLRERQGGDGPCESELEARVYEVLRGSGLPMPVLQRSVHVGGRLRRLDFWFPGHHVVLEADGYASHSSVLAFEKDRQRANSLTARGYRVLQWTWQALHERPGDLLRELAAVLSTPRVG